jgi:hypothetical protein
MTAIEVTPGSVSATSQVIVHTRPLIEWGSSANINITTVSIVCLFLPTISARHVATSARSHPDFGYSSRELFDQSSAKVRMPDAATVIAYDGARCVASRAKRLWPAGA